MQRWIKDESESELMQLLEKSQHPLRFEEIIENSRHASKKQLQRQLDKWRAQNLVEAIWLNGEVCYRAKGLPGRETEFTLGSNFRLAVIRDRERLAFASQPHIHDRLLVFFCLIALGTLLVVASYLFLG